MKARPLLCIRYGSISSPMFLTHLECTNCGTGYEWRALQNLCTKCQKPLFPVYDLAAVGKKLRKEELAARQKSLWRFREVLPLPMDVEPVTLGEGGTPLLRATRFGKTIGVRRDLSVALGKRGFAVVLRTEGILTWACCPGSSWV